MPDDYSSDLHDVETPIERQVSERIDAQTTPLELIAALDDTALDSGVFDLRYACQVSVVADIFVDC